MDTFFCLIWTLPAVITYMFINGFLYMRRKYEYWERKKVAQLKPLPFVGNFLNVFTFRNSINDIYKEAYHKFPNDKVVGIYELLTPVLVIRDPKLIEKIIVKDFHHFMHRKNIGDGKSLLDLILFQLKGKTWKYIRSKVTPAFTSGKLKLMFNHMLECSDELIEHINKNINNDYEIKKDLSAFSLDVIGNAVLGIEITDRQAREKLGKMVTTIFKPKPLKFLETFIVLNAPKLANLIGLSVISNEVTQYFKGFIKNILEQRTKNNYQRNDYIQQLIKLKERGSIEVQGNEEEDEYLNFDENTPTGSIEFTDELLTGQAFQFIVAGHDFVYLNMLYTMFELARDNRIQERVREQVKEVLQRHNGYTYESVKEMTLLEQCIQETMRLYAPSHFLSRECSKTYITDDGLVIEKGQQVIIPLSALHMDPKYYPEPEVFKPDRLPPNCIRSNFTYMPFGDGPRICIGARFSMVEMKLGLAKIIDNFRFSLTPETKVPFERNKQSPVVFPESVIKFKISAVK